MQRADTPASPSRVRVTRGRRLAVGHPNRVYDHHVAHGGLELERGPAACGEIDMPQAGARLVQGFAERHRHQLQMRRQALELGSGQRGEKMILCRAMRRGL